MARVKFRANGQKLRSERARTLLRMKLEPFVASSETIAAGGGPSRYGLGRPVWTTGLLCRDDRDDNDSVHHLRILIGPLE